jgi:hypothetical protein
VESKEVELEGERTMMVTKVGGGSQGLEGKWELMVKRSTISDRNNQLGDLLYNGVTTDSNNDLFQSHFPCLPAL